MVERLASPAAHELDALTDLWERSVRATHDFLAPEDIPFFRRMVRQEALPAAEIYVIRDSGNGFAAFAGIGADRLEMLFVAPSARGKGLGRELVEHVTVHCGVQRVDVNEQNATAEQYGDSIGEYTIDYYCSCETCRAKASKVKATGTPVVEGQTIAVDPDEIPYGTKVIIDGHVFTAEDYDTSGKEKHISIYVNEHETAQKLNEKKAEVHLVK